MRNTISVEFEIDELGDIELFRNPYGLDLDIATYSTFIGSVKIIINESEISFDEIAVFKFLLDFFSELDGLLIKDSKNNVCDIPIPEVSDVITLKLEDGFISFPNDNILKCSFFELYLNVYKAIEKLFNLLYEKDPTLVNLPINNKGALATIRGTWSMTKAGRLY